jgi:hypothetical protein
MLYIFVQLQIMKLNIGGLSQLSTKQKEINNSRKNS